MFGVKVETIARKLKPPGALLCSCSSLLARKALRFGSLGCADRWEADLRAGEDRRFRRPGALKNVEQVFASQPFQRDTTDAVGTLITAARPAARSGPSSSQIFNQRPDTDGVVPHQQGNDNRCQMVW